MIYFVTSISGLSVVQDNTVLKILDLCDTRLINNYGSMFDQGMGECGEPIDRTDDAQLSYWPVGNIQSALPPLLWAYASA